MCPSLYVPMYTLHMCVQAHVRMCVFVYGGQRTTSGAILQVVSTLFFETESVTSL